MVTGNSPQTMHGYSLLVTCNVIFMLTFVTQFRILMCNSSCNVIINVHGYDEWTMHGGS